MSLNSQDTREIDSLERATPCRQERAFSCGKSVVSLTTFTLYSTAVFCSWLSAGAMLVFYHRPSPRAQHAVHRRESGGDDKAGAGAIAGAWATREDLIETKKVGSLDGDWRISAVSAKLRF